MRSLKESAVDYIKIVSKVRISLFKLLALAPLIECHSNVIASNIEHSLGIAPAGNLLAPRGLIAEKDRITWAMIPLLEVVASLETGERLGLGDNTAGAVVVISNISRLHQIVNSFGCFVLSWDVVRTAYRNINDDIRGVKAHIEALEDGRAEIGVPDSTSIHEDVAIEMLRRENSWDRS